MNLGWGQGVDLLAMAEVLRKSQAACNSYERANDPHGTGNVALADTNHAWGHLHRAMLDILAEWYHAQQGAPVESARQMAERVLDEVYDNGEDIAYNMRLLAEGTIAVYPQHAPNY